MKTSKKTAQTRKNAVASLIAGTAKTVKVCSEWHDDHLLCCRVRVDGSKQGEVEFWWAGQELVAAFRYHDDSPKARKLVAKYVEGWLVDAEGINEEEGGKGWEFEELLSDARGVFQQELDNLNAAFEPQKRKEGA